jgi:hypothetical protein
MTPSLASMRWIVGTDRPESFAISRWSILRRARAALNWEAVIMQLGSFFEIRWFATYRMMIFNYDYVCSKYQYWNCCAQSCCGIPAFVPRIAADDVIGRSNKVPAANYRPQLSIDEVQLS